ncbi:MAG: methyltransferase domain-containing protein [Proteobacteria bacterium]|nr:methyltransferase domain-containing protein [Pseudomonadota bacterium]MBU1736787.1 methyltransferase domain-containing protein [Pseudomonadota bacterium]
METSSLHPGKLFGLASSYWQPCALHAGVKLGIFSSVARNKSTTGEIAADLGTSPRGTEALLNALTAMDLLIKKDGRFTNAPLAAAFLVKEKPGYVGHIIMHHHHLVDGWAQLDVAVKTGEPVETRDHGEEKERESFQLGMLNLALAIAPAISKEINLQGRKHLLDLGGGPGTHAIHFCLENPQLRATIFDRETTRPFALETARRFGVEKRIDFSAGDFNRDPVPGRYDVAWLSQIIHSNAPETCRKLIRKTAAALKPGGLLLIHDFFLNDDYAGPLFPALFSLNMLINNDGRSYSAAEVSEMMEESGLTDIKRLCFQGGNDSYIISGVLK